MGAHPITHHPRMSQPRGERSGDVSSEERCRIVNLRARLIIAQSDSKAAVLRYHSLKGDYTRPEVALKLSMIAQQQETEMAWFDYYHGLGPRPQPEEPRA